MGENFNSTLWLKGSVLLLDIGEKIVPLLIPLLEDSDTGIKEVVITFLGVYPNKTVIKALIPLLKDESPKSKQKHFLH
jgi:HEAT repeat protein